MDILALSYILLLVQSSAGLRLSGEPTCSNFVIEEQLLKKMVEVEIRSGVMMAEFKELAKTVKEEQQEAKQEMQRMRREFNEIKHQVHEQLRHWNDTLENDDDKMKQDLAMSVNSVTDIIKAEIQEIKRMAVEQGEFVNKTLLEGRQSTENITKGFEDTLAEYMATTSQTIEKLSNRTGFQSAFTVTRPTSGPISGTPRFHNVITNIGEDYNSTTGQFQCEHPGIYFFYLSIYKTYSASQAYCNIRHNNSNIIIANSNPETRSGNRGIHEASTSLLLHLDTGDTVDLGGCSSISYLHSYTSFSGFLVKAD